MLLSPSLSFAAPTSENVNAHRHRGPEGFKVLMEFCGGHVRQEKVHSVVQGRGWPMLDDINPAILSTRVTSLAGELNVVVMFSQTNPLFLNLVECFRVAGANHTHGINGLSSRMDHRWCGYYGNVGALIIHQELLHMFPEEAVDMDSIPPLTYSEFLMSVVVLYTSILLIQADLPGINVTFKDTYRTWMDSGEFGSLYPLEADQHSQHPPPEAVTTPLPTRSVVTGGSPAIKIENDIYIIPNSPPTHSVLPPNWVSNVIFDMDGKEDENLGPEQQL
ncbi:hypothetical protein K439DRAFT_1620752 [Ramaria rubella]|nr:hypothetical protein K439DRAFT_1620752 [Ramaria rubella]